MTSRSQLLLADNDPAPFSIVQAEGKSPFFIVCDHAGRSIPRQLGSLGLSAFELERHIAWDIGAAAVADSLAVHLDAFTIKQTYSRLVIDCNRSLDSPTSIVTLSEHTTIPGNAKLSREDAQHRAAEIFWPYHHRIVAELDARQTRGQPTVLVAMHSFTPIFKNQSRTMHAGVLYNRDTRLAHRLLHILRDDPALIVGDNEPYSISDTSDYAIPVYGEQRGLLHVEIEIRQDLIVHRAGQQEWAERLAEALPKALEGLL